MEKLKLYVYNRTEKLARLAEDYNEKLRALHYAMCQVKRHTEIANDAKNGIARINYELKDVEDNLNLMDEMNALTMANYVTAKMNYENADDSIQSVLNEKRHEELLDLRLKELGENLLVLSQFRRKKRKLQLTLANYTMLSAEATKKIEELKEDAKMRLAELRRSAEILERVLGYSIGSHMLEWCTDATGNVIREPQLMPVELVEYEESTALVSVEN